MICRLSSFLAVTIILLAPGYSSAHGVHVFATVENQKIVGEGSLSGGTKVRNGKISILRQDDEQLLLTTQTDASGRFEVPLEALGIEKATDLIVILDAGPGHRSTWQLKAEDYSRHPAREEGPSPSPPNAESGSDLQMPAYPPLKNIITGVICIIGLGFLIAWARKKGGPQ